MYSSGRNISFDELPFVVQQWLNYNNFDPNFSYIKTSSVSCYFDNIIIDFTIVNDRIKRIRYSPRNCLREYV